MKSLFCIRPPDVVMAEALKAGIIVTLNSYRVKPQTPAWHHEKFVCRDCNATH